MVRRSAILQLLKLISILNSFYSLRELEALLGIPFQSIWRYVNFKSIPRKDTAYRILNRVKELRLINTIFLDLLSKHSDIVSLSSDLRFLKLLSLLVHELMGKDRVDVVLPLSLEAIPIAVVISLEMNANICFVYEGNLKLHPSEKYIISHYVSKDNEPKIITIPQQCLKPRAKVVLVDVVASDVNKLVSLLNILKRRGCVSPMLVFMDVHNHELLHEISRKYGVKIRNIKSYILREYGMN